MPDNTLEKDRFEFLNQGGAFKLAQGILNIVNARIQERITLEVGSSSDELHVPSAAAVYRAIINSKHMSIRIVTGDIDEQVPLDERSPNVIYWQRDSVEDTTWQIYIWVVGQPPDLDGNWLHVGDTEADLENYWSKSEADVATLKLVLGINDLAAQVATKASIDSVNELAETVNTIEIALEGKASAADLAALAETVSGLPTFDDLDTKVNKDDLGGLPLTIVQSVLDEAYAETDILAPPHTLTVNFLYPDERTPIAEPYTASLKSGTVYNVNPPAVENYMPTVTHVMGTMVNVDKTINVPYEIIDDPTNPKRLLSIAYEVPEGFEALKPETVIELLSVGAEYTVASPEISGLTADKATITGIIGDDNVIETVTYTTT